MDHNAANISRMSWMLSGIVIGAVAMFVWDPEQGNRRRALARDKMHNAKRKVRDTMEAGATRLRRNATQASSPSASATPEIAGNAALVGAYGGTDAAVGAHLSGSKGGPGGPSLKENAEASGMPGSPGGMTDDNAINPAAGGTGLTGGEMSGARDAAASVKGNSATT